MGTQAISLKGGSLVLECWRADLGSVPARAFVSVPGLFDEPRAATINPDGRVRARINPRDVKAASAGAYTATWTLGYYVTGHSLMDDEDEPPTEEWEVESEFELTDDPAKLSLEATWFDADGLPTPAYLRDKQTFGLPLIDQTGRLMPDEAIQAQIDAAIARVENDLGILMRRRLVSSVPTFDAPVDEETGEPMRVYPEAAYDYDPSAFRRTYGFLRLRQTPVRKLHAVELWLGASRITTLPEHWLHLNPSSGDVQLMPGTLSGIAIPGSVGMPIVTGAYGGPTIPHLWHVAYEAGGAFRPDGTRDMSLCDVVGWIAAQVLLIIASDSVTAGLASQSMSIDGVSQSYATTNSSTNSTYGANVLELEKRIKTWFTEQAPHYRGIRMVVA